MGLCHYILGVFKTKKTHKVVLKISYNAKKYHHKENKVLRLYPKKNKT